MFVLIFFKELLPICLRDDKIIDIQLLHDIVKFLLVDRFLPHSIYFESLVNLIKFIFDDNVNLLIEVLSGLCGSLDLES